MKRLVLMFPGQGSQYVGMGACLYKGSPVARKVFEEVDECLGRFVSREMFSGTVESLSRTIITQPALLAHSVSIFRCLEEDFCVNLKPSWLLGHSVGEYAALVCAGSLSLSAAARLIYARGEAMQAAADACPSPCTMQALLFAPPPEVGNERKALHDLQAFVHTACQESSQVCKGVVGIAALNSPTQVVLSGHTHAVEHATGLLGRSGSHPKLRRSVKLPVSAPFHSPIMAPAAEVLQGALTGGPPLGPCATPLVAGLHARPVTSPADLEVALVRGVVSPVQWGSCVSKVVEENGGVNGVHFLEMGGVVGGTLGSLVKLCFWGATTTSLSTLDALHALAKSRLLE